MFEFLQSADFIELLGICLLILIVVLTVVSWLLWMFRQVAEMTGNAKWLNTTDSIQQALQQAYTLAPLGDDEFIERQVQARLAQAKTTPGIDDDEFWKAVLNKLNTLQSQMDAMYRAQAGESINRVLQDTAEKNDSVKLNELSADAQRSAG